MKKSIFALAAILIVAGCYSTQQTMDSWIGSSKKDLIMSWGPPDRIASDGGDGEILVYAKQVYVPAQTGISTVGSDGNVHTSSGTPSRTYWDYKLFYINKNSIIYHWLTRRESVPPKEINLNLNIH
jgi:hypothetical protein